MKRAIQCKTQSFMKVVNTNVEYNDQYDLNLQQTNDIVGVIVKKKANMMDFLALITQQTVGLMENYLIQNQKKYKSLVRKPKMLLYEDILIIYNFAKELDNLRFDRKNVMDSLAKRLHYEIGRSEVTIKQRISKKLWHLTIQEIQLAMRQKKEYLFDGKKNVEPIKQGKGQKQSKKQEQSYKSLGNEQIYSKSSVYKPLEARKAFANSFTKEKTSRLYKYGAKELKQRIFIHASVHTNCIKSYKQSVVTQFRYKHKFQEIEIKQTNTPRKQNSERNNSHFLYNIPHIQSQQISNANDIFVGKKYDEMSQKQLLVLAKDFASHIKIKIQNNGQIKARQKVNKCLKKIENVQRQLSISSKQTKKTQISLLKKESFQIIQKCESYSQEDIDKKSTTQSIYERQQQILLCSEIPQQQIELQNRLFSVCNNIRYIQLINDNKSLESAYVWSPEEDDILWKYKQHAQMHKTQMKCLLRYKQKQIILERVVFLDIDLDRNRFFDNLTNLQSRQTSIVIKKQVQKLSKPPNFDDEWDI